MRIPEWYWWVEALLALAASVGAAVAPVIYLGNQLPLDQELGFAFTSDLLLAAALGGVFLLLTLMLVITSARSRMRYRQRKAALSGNLDALPLSRITPKPENDPDVAAQPLVLLWSASRGMRVFAGPLHILLVMVQAAVPVLLLVVTGVALVQDPRSIFSATWTQLLAVIGALCLGVAVIVLLVVYAHVVPTYFGRPFGVMATDEGVECHTELGRRFFVPWNEMRLFEVDGSGATGLGLRRFRLYGSRHTAEWHDHPLKYNEYAPHGMTPEEMAARLKAMVDLIAARTNLVPRTLSKSLRLPGTGAVRRASRERAGGAVLGLLLFGVFTLACSGAALLLPLTTSVVLNIAVAGSLVALVVALVGLNRYDRRRSLRYEQYVATPALPPESPSGKYTVRSGMEAHARVVLAIVGAALSVNMLPAFALLAKAVLVSTTALPQWLPSVPSAIATPVIWLLCLYGLMGVVLVRMTISGGVAEVRATTSGLSMLVANRPVTLLWEDVGAVTARTRQGRIVRYVVASKVDKVKFSWPADPARSLPLRAGDDSLSLTPGELAALASARSATPIEVREL